MKRNARRTQLTTLCIVILLAGFATNLVAQSLTVIDVPGAGGTWPVSINNRGDVTGYYCPSVFFCDSQTRRGFVRDAKGNIEVFDGTPGGINDAGLITGYGYFGHSFVRDKAGNIEIFDVPQPFPPNPAATFSMAINNRGDVAGFLIPCPTCDTYQGFVREPKGDVTTFVIPKGLVATSINARGDITGHTAPFFMTEDGFVRDRKGDITIFDVGDNSPGPRAFPLSINNRGDVTGIFYDPHFNRRRGFIRKFNGDITVFDPAPNADTINAVINEGGTVAGDFRDASGQHNFLLDHKGTVTVFDIPNALGTHTLALNNRSDVAGYFFYLRDGSLTARGFVRSAH